MPPDAAHLVRTRAQKNPKAAFVPVSNDKPAGERDYCARSMTYFTFGGLSFTQPQKSRVLSAAAAFMNWP